MPDKRPSWLPDWLADEYDRLPAARSFVPQPILDVADWIEKYQQSPEVQARKLKLAAFEQQTPQRPSFEIPQALKDIASQAKGALGSYFTPPADVQATGEFVKSQLDAQHPDVPAWAQPEKAITKFAIDNAIDATTPGGAALNLVDPAAPLLKGAALAAKGAPGAAVALAKFRPAEKLAKSLIRNNRALIEGTALEEGVHFATREAPRTFSHVNEVTPYGFGGDMTVAQASPFSAPTRSGKVADVRVNKALIHADPTKLGQSLVHEGTHVGQIVRLYDQYKRSPLAQVMPFDDYVNDYVRAQGPYFDRWWENNARVAENMRRFAGGQKPTTAAGRRELKGIAENVAGNKALSDRFVLDLFNESIQRHPGGHRAFNEALQESGPPISDFSIFDMPLASKVEPPPPREFFSRLDDAVATLPNQAHPNKYASLFKNATTQEELDYRKMSDLLQGKSKVTLDEIKEHLKRNPAPEIRQTQLGSGPTSFEDWLRTQTEFEVTPEDVQKHEPLMRRLYDIRVRDGRLANATKFGDGDGNLQVPGGTNYRETLLQLPDLTNAFTKGHFDQPNVVAHVRHNERPTAQGDPIRFIEEIQSDWHQQGKKQGYKTGAPKQEQINFATWVERNHPNMSREEMNSRFDDLDDPLRRQWDAEHEAAYRHNIRESGGPPDAPFKDSWPDLALKQQLMEVARDPKLQGIGFTTGRTQADRYNLGKYVSRVEYDPENMILEAWDKVGDTIYSELVSPRVLPDYIGADATKRLLASKPTSVYGRDGVVHTLGDVDVHVEGGEGMHEFYDRLLPKRLEKLLKPFGAKVEKAEVTTTPQRQGERLRRNAFDPPPGAPDLPVAIERRADGSYEDVLSFLPQATEQDAERLLGQYRDRIPMGTEQAWFARLTPEQKQAIKQKGFPIFLAFLAAHGMTSPAAERN